MRILTNDDATANKLSCEDSQQEAMAWSPALSLGRLAPGADLDVFGAIRATFLSSLGWDDAATLEADHRFRHEALLQAVEGGEELRLLFGASLLDQLQLAQILFVVSEAGLATRERIRCSVVDGPLAVFEAGALQEIAREGEPLADELVAAYRGAWQAVTGPSPIAVERLFHDMRQQRQQPALAAALERWLQELPSVDNGLSITESQILDAVRLGVTQPRPLFEAVQETESLPFRTDWEFWQILSRLAQGEQPLLRDDSGRPFLTPPADMAWEAFHAQRLELTDRGLEALEGGGPAVGLELPSRWLGGALIESPPAWWWDYAGRRVATELG